MQGPFLQRFFGNTQDGEMQEQTFLVTVLVCVEVLGMNDA